MVSIIKRLMPKPSFVLTLDDQEEVYFQMFLWNLGFLDSIQLYANLTKYARSPEVHGITGLRPSLEMRNWISTYRWQVFQDFDCTRLKLAVLHLITHQIDADNESYILRYLRRCRLPDDSYVLIRYLMKIDHVWNPFKRFLATHLREPGVADELVFDYRALIQQCNEDFDKFNIKTQAKKLAGYKMKFIADSNRMSTLDLATDLIERAVAYYYRERPLKTRLHCVNYAKRSLKGRTNQLITYWTKPERSMYLKDEHGMNISRQISITEEVITGFESDNTWGQKLSIHED